MVSDGGDEENEHEIYGDGRERVMVGDDGEGRENEIDGEENEQENGG